jgi:flavin-binding monooxygenase-like protein
MAYLPFPKNWPQFTPKDKLGDWLEAYASVLELNVWTSTSIKSAEYDTEKSEWTAVVIQKNGNEKTLRPRHLIWCTGHAAEPLSTSLPGQGDFKGIVYHGIDHQDASLYVVEGKNVVVVGTGNSGHDIAEDFYQNGAKVTMIQRSGTYVITTTKGIPLLHSGSHNEHSFVKILYPITSPSSHTIPDHANLFSAPRLSKWILSLRASQFQCSSSSVPASQITSHLSNESISMDWRRPGLNCITDRVAVASSSCTTHVAEVTILTRVAVS